MVGLSHGSPIRSVPVCDMWPAATFLNLIYTIKITKKSPYLQRIYATDRDLEVQCNLDGDQRANKSADGQKAEPNTLFPPDRLVS